MTREDPYKWFAKTVTDMQSRLAKINDLKEALVDVTGEAESDDGSIKVTVGPKGAITSLDIRRSAYRLSPPELSETIVETIRVAAARAAENLAELLAPVMGDAGQLRSRVTTQTGVDGEKIKQSLDTLRDVSRDTAPARDWSPQ